MPNDLSAVLGGNAYPGRGIAAGRSADGKKSLIIYFIMGRSLNSRNRVFERTDDGIRTKAFDPSELTDPSLVIYHPVRLWERGLIVTNGDQTDTILRELQSGGDFRSALTTREFEPDPPIYTPRISALIDRRGGYSLSILKSLGGDPSCCCRYFFEYGSPQAGVGHFISTYQSDGNPPPSFAGEPIPLALGDDIETLAREAWNALNADNKVALYGRSTDIDSGKFTDIIINKNTIEG